MNKRVLVVVSLGAALFFAPQTFAGHEFTPMMIKMDLGTKFDIASEWDKDAESAFSLPGGFGERLMTESDWREHEHRMQGMSESEREKYKAEVRKSLIQRARVMGIDIVK